MTDIEQRLRAAMHAAVDAEEAAADEVLRGVYRRHRRHSLLVASLAVLLALAVAIPAAIAARSLTAPPEPAAPQSLPLPTKMAGLPMPPGTNFQLLVQGGEWYSTASQRAEAIKGVPSGGYAFTRVPGGWSLTTLLAGWSCPPHCWNGAYFVADGSTSATRIGTGLELAAAAHPGEVWLLSYPRNIASMAKASPTIQLFSTTGRALGPHYRLPAGYVLVRGIGRYLLLTQGPPPNTSNSDLDRAAVLWDPGSGRVVDRFPDVIDAGPDVIAWSPQCRGCHVRLLNVPTGKSVSTPIPAGQLTGGFTDDGDLLAIRLPTEQLAVYNTSSRVLTEIPGTALNNSDWQLFGWLNGSHTLVVTAGSGLDLSTGPPGPDQLAYWQPGDTQLRIATITDQDEIGALQSWAF